MKIFLFHQKKKYFSGKFLKKTKGEYEIKYYYIITVFIFREYFPASREYLGPALIIERAQKKLPRQVSYSSPLSLTWPRRKGQMAFACKCKLNKLN